VILLPRLTLLLAAAGPAAGAEQVKVAATILPLYDSVRSGRRTA
jgi:hypothetical protein